MTNPLQPDAALLCKLGSIMVHADEMRQPHAHSFDAGALAQLLADPQVEEWRKAMDAMAMLPKMRQGFERKPIAHAYHSRIKNGPCTDCRQPKSAHR